MTEPKTVSTNLNAWDNYLDWTDKLARHPLEELFEPVFLEATGSPRVVSDLFQSIKNSPILRLDLHELEILNLSILEPLAPQEGGPTPAEITRTLFVYRPVDRTKNYAHGLPKGVKVLDVGAPVLLGSQREFSQEPREENDLKGLRPAPPIVAMIDTSIAFLNERFCWIDEDGTTRRTRFDAVWIQALEQSNDQPSNMVRIGRVFQSSCIDEMLAEGAALDEAQTYKQMNTKVFGQGVAHRPNEFSVSHGTQVLDLAAGMPLEKADPNGADKWLMAVQLPPEATADTSGMRFESYVLQAVRWILRQAVIANSRGTPIGPVIINLSFGMLAGPKDGTHFLERQIAKELELFEQTHQKRARVVMAYGNAYQSRQVAKLDVVGAEPNSGQLGEMGLGWQLQPDDHTPNHLEIYGDNLHNLHFTVHDPLGNEVVHFKPVKDMPSTKARIIGGNAALYWIKKPDGNGKPHLALTIAQTAFANGQPTAPAGLWRITITNPTKTCQRLHFQVQRDDTLPGHRLGGRQSYLVASGGDGFDNVTRDYRKLTNESSVTHEGTHSGFGSLEHARIFRVGAAMKAPQKPADYTASGGGISISNGPDCAAIADDSRALRGVVAAGTLSGSVRMLSGTSAAAPQITRLLSETAAIMMDPKDNVQEAQTEELAEIEAAASVFDTISDPARLGAFVASAPRNKERDRQRVPS